MNEIGLWPFWQLNRGSIHCAANLDFRSLREDSLYRTKGPQGSVTVLRMLITKLSFHSVSITIMINALDAVSYVYDSLVNPEPSSS